MEHCGKESKKNIKTEGLCNAMFKCKTKQLQPRTQNNYRYTACTIMSESATKNGWRKGLRKATFYFEFFLLLYPGIGRVMTFSCVCTGDSTKL